MRSCKLISLTALALCLTFPLAIAIEVDPSSFSSIIFDYIVIGAGTTGLAVATRLSDDPTVLVGVIEAGPYKADNNILVPGYAGATVGNPEYDWLLSTTPQERLNGRTIDLGRGKLVGGTSNMNYMGYTRASVAEYNGWVQLGNQGWDFETMFDLMVAAESWTPPDDIFVRLDLANNDTFNHGRTGPVLTTPHHNFSSIVSPFFSSLESLGVPPNLASHGGSSVGAYSVIVTLDAHNRSRCTTTTAYYDPNASRQNLVVLTNSQVTKLEFANVSAVNSTQTATGVQYFGSDNQTYIALARQEVIVSAGSVKTPQVLELSGIGNATLLRSLGIPTLVDLPGVGENLQDHPGVVVEFQTVSSEVTTDELRDAEIASEHSAQYVENRTGLYSGAPSSVSFMPFSMFMPSDVLADLKQELDAARAVDAKYTTPSFELERTWMDDGSVPQVEFILFPQSVNSSEPASERFYTVNVVMLHPWARGTVHITSSDALTQPNIDTQYLQSPSDVDTKILMAGIQFMQNASQTEPLRSLTTSTIGPALNSTDDQLLTWIEENLSTNYHVAGTTAMLSREENGVVDSNLLVYGTANVRVVDISVFPLHLGTHPVSILYGITEKAVEVILSARH